MSSAYSTLHNYAALPVYTPDVNLVAQGLQYKQQKYDRNKERLQKAFDKYSMLDVAKDPDKQYIAERLEKAEELVNKYTHMDLSSEGLTQSLMRTMGTVVDDNVKNAVMSTRMFRAEQQEWNQAKEENLGLYADQNYWYAMQNASQWLNDGQVGTKYKGGGGFIPYDDVAKRLMDEMPDQIKAIKDEWVELQSPSGGRMYYDKVTMEAVPAEEVQAVVDTIVGQKGRNQLRIDALYQFNNMGEDQAYSQVEGVRSSKVNNLQRQLSSLQDMNKNGEYDKAIQLKKSKLERLKNTPVSSLSRDQLESEYANMYIQNFEEGIVNAYAKGPTVVDREIDKNHLETVKYQERVMEASKKSTEKASGEAGTGVLPGSVVEIGEEEGYKEEEPAFQSIVKQQRDAIDQVKSIQGFDKLNDSEISMLAKNWDTSVKPSESGFITMKIGDKTLKINENDTQKITALNQLKDKLSPESPKNKKVYSNVKSAMRSTRDSIIRSIDTGNESIGDLPRMDFSIKDGKIVRGETNYGMIVNKVLEGLTLTEDEESTLDMYTSLHQISSGDLSAEEKRLAFDVMRDNIVEKVGYEGFTQLGYDSYTDVVEGSPGAVSDVVSQATQNPFLGMAAGMLVGSPSFDVDTDDWEPARKNIEALYETTEMKTTRESVIVPKGAKGFDELNAFLGKDALSKEPIEIWRELGSDGNPTGNFRWRYDVRSGGKEPTKTTVSWEDEGEGVITAKQAQELGLNFVSLDETPYDAERYGEDAQSIDLGNTDYTTSEVNKYVEANRESPIFMSEERTGDLVESLLQGLEGQYLEDAANKIETFMEGGYEVSIQPESDGFYYVNYNPSPGYNVEPIKEILLDSNNQPVSRMNSLDAIYYSRDASIALKENNFYNYIKRYTDKAKTKSFASKVKQRG